MMLWLQFTNALKNMVPCLSKPKQTFSSEKELDTGKVSADLHSFFPDAKIDIFAGKLFCIDDKDWATVFKDVLFGLPPYITEKFVCINFVFAVVGRVMERYYLNTCGIAIGGKQDGDKFVRHAFQIVISNQGYSFIDPQTGDGEPVSGDTGFGYKIDTVMFP